MRIFNRYILKNLAIATIFMSVTLSIIIFLTQSLRFLELVISAGTPSSVFWILTFLALPRSFVIILPLSLMASTLFIYNRMTMDSEVIAARSIGYSPYAMARPAITLAIIVTVFLWVMTMWVVPKSLSNMLVMKRVIQTQFSTLLFQEGVFNKVGEGLTVYIKERNAQGDLYGLMIHDSRKSGAPPSTVIAQRGVIVSSDGGHQVVVYEGSRQEFDAKNKTMRILNFERYTIDLPDSAPARQRWKGADERTIFELLNPDMSQKRNIKEAQSFKVEIHQRIASPLLALVYAVISCAALLLGPADRRGYGRRIAFTVISVVLLQGLFLASANIAHQTDWGILFMYGIVGVPLFFGLFMLSGISETFRRRTLYKRDEGAS